MAFANVSGISDIQVDGEVMRCLLTGRADGLVKAAARYPVATILAEEPDLEELFFTFYRGEEASDAA